MKKSEMIKILANEIAGEYSWDGPKTRIGLEYAYYIAQNVLEKIEEEGMAPPGYLQPVENPLVPGDIPMKDGGFGTPVYKWEPEDV